MRTYYLILLWTSAIDFLEACLCQVLVENDSSRLDSWTGRRKIISNIHNAFKNATTTFFSKRALDLQKSKFHNRRQIIQNSHLRFNQEEHIENVVTSSSYFLANWKAFFGFPSFVGHFWIISYQKYLFCLPLLLPLKIILHLITLRKLNRETS